MTLLRRTLIPKMLPRIKVYEMRVGGNFRAGKLYERLVMLSHTLLLDGALREKQQLTVTRVLLYGIVCD